jgi:hypothetical protein
MLADNLVPFQKVILQCIFTYGMHAFLPENIRHLVHSEISFPEMEFLDINLTKRLESFAPYQFAVPSTGGFVRKPYSSLVLKLRTKNSAKNENSKNEGRKPDKTRV